MCAKNIRIMISHMMTCADIAAWQWCVMIHSWQSIITWIIPHDSIDRIPVIVVSNQELKCVESAKLLGVTISNNLTWNDHIGQTIKEASKRMFFLIQLKRAKVSRHEITLFYATCIRSVLMYASPVFFYALPMYLRKDLERVEKRALSIICPRLAYREALEFFHIDPILD